MKYSTLIPVLRNITELPFGNWDSAVGIVTGYGLGDRVVGARVPVGSNTFSSPNKSVPGTLSYGIKRPGREIDNSNPTSDDVKKTWIYASTPPYVFMA
jgi:hypothetical protein